ncbi:chloride channel protein [Paraoerskovia marina]|uniref:chloride channel protein n=1 Tax=Paraoerskovia marina TaxID=545619 RepID=UPI0015607FB6|nr:chloride channel protein [Paraoerskovia marina]
MSTSDGRRQGPADPSAPPAVRARETWVVLGLAALVGALSAVGATVYSSLVHETEALLWDTLPSSWGADVVPAWWVFLVLGTGAVAVWGAKHLHGHGGHHPLGGLAFDITPRQLPSTLLAAFATLVCGAVVGPEAPLLAIGTSIGFVAVARARSDRAKILVIAGAAAALGVVMGNPLVTVFLILEAALLMPGSKSPQPLTQLLPVLVALGTGYLVHVGIADWPGMSSHPLDAGDLGTYGTVDPTDLAVGAVVALAAGALVIAATRSAETLRPLADRHPLPVILGGGLLIAAIAVVARAISGEDVDTVLFSGQSTMSALTDAGALALVVIAVAKAAGYAISLGTGFRGGSIFPAVYLGMAVGALGSFVPGATLPGLVACGIAAGAAATLGMPLTSTMLAVLLTASAGPAVTVTAILGAVIGVMLKVWLDRRRAGVRPDLPGVDDDLSLRRTGTRES